MPLRRDVSAKLADGSGEETTLMRRVLVLAALALAVPITALAHVTVNPRTSKPGTDETYSVRVPKEKQVATTSVDLEVPDGVIILGQDSLRLGTGNETDDGRGGINTGWIDYRDNHLGRELKSYQNLQFAHGNTRVQLLPGGNSAYATSEYSLKAKAGERDIDARGLETLVLVKGQDGAWKIRHAHTSSRPARRPPAV
jgi:hypothetical protein